MSWVLIIVGLCALIILHELGHFTVAKLVGMRVEKFSLFFPPTIWSFKRGETEYAIGALPLGGYVSITGMNPRQDLPEEVRDRAYHAQPVWKRMAVIAAGPAMNFIVAFVLLMVVYWGIGAADTTSTVAAIQPKSPAQGKLLPGDKLIAVDGKRGTPLQLRTQIGTHKCAGKQVNGCPAATPVALTVERRGRLRSIVVRPRFNKAANRVLIGFTYGETRKALPFGKSVSQAGSNLWWITKQTVKIPAYIFNSHKRKQISGIVGISDATHKAISRDAGDAIGIFAIISLSLAIINLFPFLPLDGGHIFWALVEGIRRRPVPYAVMERAGVLGFMLVIGLFLLGLTNDIDRLTSGTGVR